VSPETILKAGIYESRGQTLISGPKFLVCGQMNGLDYKSPRKRPWPIKLGIGRGPHAVMRVIASKSDSDLIVIIRTIRHEPVETIQGNIICQTRS